MPSNKQPLGYNFFYLKGEDNSYLFETESELIYEIKFKPTPYFFSKNTTYSDNTYEFVIEIFYNPTSISPPFDKRVSKTISDIFEDFYLKNSETVTIYICDSSDGRQMARSRKFHIWFEEFQHENYLKIDVILVDSAKNRFPTSLILRRNNPYLLQIFEEFENITSGYNNQK
jgi:hypothetical protein